jgi:ribosomal protein S18 acetylase RimI-like enzyme
VAAAKVAGYDQMRLDTSVGQAEAIGLYKSAGFKPIPPYYPLPDDIKHWLVFMELKL